jgi:hypothetical protein
LSSNDESDGKWKVEAAWISVVGVVLAAAVAGLFNLLDSDDGGAPPPTQVAVQATTTSASKPPTTTNPKVAACLALRKAASREKQALSKLRESFVDRGGTVSLISSMSAYEQAHDNASQAVNAAGSAFVQYRDTDLPLPKTFKFADDLGVISDDLQRLDAGVRSGSIPGAPWNQLHDYAEDAGEVAEMRCPTK